MYGIQSGKGVPQCVGAFFLQKSVSQHQSTVLFCVVAKTSVAKGMAGTDGTRLPNNLSLQFSKVPI